MPTFPSLLHEPEPEPSSHICPLLSIPYVVLPYTDFEARNTNPPEPSQAVRLLNFETMKAMQVMKGRGGVSCSAVGEPSCQRKIFMQMHALALHPLEPIASSLMLLTHNATLSGCALIVSGLPCLRFITDTHFWLNECIYVVDSGFGVGVVDRKPHLMES